MGFVLVDIRCVQIEGNHRGNASAKSPSHSTVAGGAGLTPDRYIICTTPRSGSNLLCDLLLGSGAMGRPREVFNIKATLVPVAKQNGLLDGEPEAVEMGAYLDLVLTKYTTQNGVFGA